jgi:hypothetical protein
MILITTHQDLSQNFEQLTKLTLGNSVFGDSPVVDSKIGHSTVGDAE